MADDPPLYTACVPPLLRHLAALERVLAAVAALPTPARDAVLQARLAPDMLPFAAQVRTAARFAVRAACPLAGQPLPPPPAEPGPGAPPQVVLDGLQPAVDAARAALQALPPAAFAGADQRIVEDRAGQATVRLAAERGLDMPVAAMVARLVAQEVSVSEAIRHLMSRPLKQE